MKIAEIANKEIKINKRSITVVDGNGKTRGVVTHITKATDMQLNKLMEHFSDLRLAGLWGAKIDGIMNCVIEIDNSIYYLHNLKPIEFYEKYFCDNDFEKEYYELRKKLAENAAKYFTVIPCYIVQN